MKDVLTEYKQVTEELADVLSWRRYPIVWYQRLWLLHIIDSLFITLLLLLSLAFFGTRPPMLLSCFCIALFLFGNCLDIYTTFQLTKLNSMFLKFGLHPCSKETNPLLSKQPEMRDFVFSVHAVIVLLVCFAIYFVPLAGIGFTFSMVLAVLNNHRHGARGRHKISLFHELYQPQTKRKRYPTKGISVPSLPISIG